MWDVFISHAREDKAAVARPLAEALVEAGLTVWYDTMTLKVGDGLRRSIDEGIAKCRFGIVILSPDFFKKHWTQRELDGLTTREMSSGKLILPVWHRVTREDVERFSPTLADKLSASTANGIDAVVREILEVVRPAVSSLDITPAAPAYPSFSLPNVYRPPGFGSATKTVGGKGRVSDTLGYTAAAFFRRDWEVRSISADGTMTRDLLQQSLDKQMAERARKHARGDSTSYIDGEIAQTRRMLKSMTERNVDEVDYLHKDMRDFSSSLRSLAAEILNEDNPDASHAASGSISQRMLDDARSRYISEGRSTRLALVDELGRKLGLS